MSTPNKTWTGLVWFIIIFLLMGLLGLFVHEVGHGITANILGGEFTALYTLPGIQVWPHFGQPYPGVWHNYFGMAYYSSGPGWAPNGWQSGLVALMGSGSNLLIAALALAFLWIFRPSRGLAYFLVAESLMFLDLPLYTFLPLLGLRHFVIYGGASPEPLEGALQIGIPQWLFLVVVGAVSVLMLWGLIQYVRRHPLWNA